MKKCIFGFLTMAAASAFAMDNGHPRPPGSFEVTSVSPRLQEFTHATLPVGVKGIQYEAKLHGYIVPAEQPATIRIRQTFRSYADMRRSLKETYCQPLPHQSELTFFSGSRQVELSLGSGTISTVRDMTFKYREDGKEQNGSVACGI